MSIKPIDLQTLFVKLDDVGRAQSQVKEQSALQQSQAAREQVNKEIEDDRKVNETPQDSETGAIKDDESESSSERRGGRRQKRRDSQESGKSPEVVRDPEVGRHIDLSG